MINPQNFTYHCHTNFSDGANTLDEMVAQAKKLGFSELGISDHLIVHKNIFQSPSQKYWNLRPNYHIYQRDFKSILPTFQKHCSDIREISKREHIKIYVGFEVDYFTYSGWEEEFREFLRNIDYDYVINANHFFTDENCENVIDISYAKYDISPEAIAEYNIRHFQTMRIGVQSRLFKFLAHMDYVRKCGVEQCSADSCRNEKLAVLAALQENNIGIELSTKGLRKIGDFYPCSWILDEVARLGIKVVISDDAHKTTEMGNNFDKAELELSKRNIVNRMRF